MLRKRGRAHLVLKSSETSKANFAGFIRITHSGRHRVGGAAIDPMGPMGPVRLRPGRLSPRDHFFGLTIGVASSLPHSAQLR
jgi:hypothetical protein